MQMLLDKTIQTISQIFNDNNSSIQCYAFELYLIA